MMHPPGSRPGMSSFATIPAINPKTIQLKIPKSILLCGYQNPPHFSPSSRNVPLCRSLCRGSKAAAPLEVVPEERIPDALGGPIELLRYG